MGDTEQMMKLTLALAFLAFAVALPSPDTMVPETNTKFTDVNGIKHAAAAEAKAAIQELLQQGQTNDACAELAKTAIEEVQDSVAEEQEVLDGFKAPNDGSQCASEGQAAVEAAENALKDAQDAAEEAAQAASDAEKAGITFDPISLSALTESDGSVCGPWASSSAYTSAKATAASTAATAAEKQGAIAGFEQALAAAQAEAEEQVKRCECSVYEIYTNAYETAKSHEAENLKTYTKGKHMQCVIEETDPNDCPVDDVPTITPVTLADGVDGSGCETQAPTAAPTSHPPTSGAFSTPTGNWFLRLVPLPYGRAADFRQGCIDQCARYASKPVSDNSVYNSGQLYNIGNNGHLAESRYFPYYSSWMGQKGSGGLGDFLAAYNFCLSAASNEKTHMRCSEHKADGSWTGGGGWQNLAKAQSLTYNGQPTKLLCAQPNRL